MTKITLDRETFRALASDTRLDILRALDGKKMSLKDISKATNLNKATLHEHLSKLNEAGLIKKKEREGHKWVYYKLSWKGESLLHPENTKIVVLFTTTFVALCAGIIQMISYVKGTLVVQPWQYKSNTLGEGDMGAEPAIVDSTSGGYANETITRHGEGLTTIYQDPILLYIAIACFIVFTIVLCIAIWRFQKNKTPKI